MRIPLNTCVMLPLLTGLWVVVPSVRAQTDTIYECPGRSFTNMISSAEATTRGCKVSSKIQAVITVPAGSRPATSGGAGNGPVRTASMAPVPPGMAPARPDARIDPADQRARDSDARRILEAELRKEEERLAALTKEYNAGEPERRGDERNFARYQERVTEMRAALARKESDIAALKRELAKLP
jgi:hypothetical protein